MSVRVMARVWEMPLHFTDKCLLLTLAWYAEDDGTRVFPTVATMSQRSGLCRAAVQQGLRRLEHLGHLVVVTPAAQHSATVYRIRIETLQRPTEQAPSRQAPISQTPISLPQNGSRGLSGSSQGPTRQAQSVIDPSVKKICHRRVRFPSDFNLTPDRRHIGQKIGVATLDAEFEKFRDYHTAKGSMMVDWDAAWRTWCRNALSFASRNGKAVPAPLECDRIPSPEESWERLQREKAARLARQKGPA